MCSTYGFPHDRDVSSPRLFPLWQRDLVKFACVGRDLLESSYILFHQLKAVGRVDLNVESLIADAFSNWTVSSIVFDVSLHVWTLPRAPQAVTF